jgi:hypothetical protein
MCLRAGPVAGDTIAELTRSPRIAGTGAISQAAVDKPHGHQPDTIAEPERWKIRVPHLR